MVSAHLLSFRLLHAFHGVYVRSREIFGKTIAEAPRLSFLFIFSCHRIHDIHPRITGPIYVRSTNENARTWNGSSEVYVDEFLADVIHCEGCSEVLAGDHCTTRLYDSLQTSHGFHLHTLSTSSSCIHSWGIHFRGSCCARLLPCWASMLAYKTRIGLVRYKYPESSTTCGPRKSPSPLPTSYLLSSGVCWTCIGSRKVSCHPEIRSWLPEISRPLLSCYRWGRCSCKSFGCIE